MAKNTRWVTPTYVSGQPVTVAERSPTQPKSDHPIGHRCHASNITNAPKFAHNQTVAFKGGTGKILHQRPDSGTWTYIVEMELGPEPEIGRVGSETKILLHESDIQGVMV